MRDGKWPARPPTGYIDPPVRSQRVKTEGSFVKPGLVWAEVEVRLGQCGQDGLLAIGYYLGYSNMDWMTRWQNRPEDAIWRSINRALSYAGSGPCRRWEGCEGRRDIETCGRKKRDGAGHGGVGDGETRCRWYIPRETW